MTNLSAKICWNWSIFVGVIWNCYSGPFF